MDLASINLEILDLAPNYLGFKNHESLRQYHKYHSVWTPRIGKELVAKHKSHNTFDRCTVTATKLLPVAISCKTSTIGNFKFCTVFGYPRRVSIVQRCWCSPWTRTTGSRRSRNSNKVQIMKRYVELVNGHYKELVNRFLTKWRHWCLKHWYPTSQNQMWKSMLESDYLRVVDLFENSFSIY